MKNFLSKIKRMMKKAPVSSPSGVNPHRHWMIIVRTFLVVTACFIIYSFFLLYQIKNEQVSQINPTVKEENSLLKESLLKDVTATFDAKEKKEQELLTSPGGWGDPSL